MLNDDVKDFLKTFRILTYGNSKWQVWQDFIFMSACSFSNVVAKNDYVNRENAYLQTINKYNERDRKLFPKLLAKLTMALEHNPEQDFIYQKRNNDNLKYIRKGYSRKERKPGQHTPPQFFHLKSTRHNLASLSLCPVRRVFFGSLIR